MNVKQILMASIAMVVSAHLLCRAENEVRLLQTNSDWHITAGSFSNAPFCLVPSNAYYVRFFPLKNGQWVWTTNMNAQTLNESVIDTHGVEFDEKKLPQVE